jgi:hypothetical protein
MTLVLGGTVSTNSFTEQLTLVLGGTASTISFTEETTKNAAFGRGLDRSTNLTTGGVGLAVAELTMPTAWRKRRAGHDGGRVVFEGTPADIVTDKSTLTGEHLAAYVGA